MIYECNICDNKRTCKERERVKDPKKCMYLLKSEQSNAKTKQYTSILNK